MELAPTVNLVLSVGAMIAQAISLVLVISLFSAKVRSSSLVRLLGSRALWIALVVAAVATAGSLTYSDVIGYEPCVLCWFQRIFMYPLVVMLAIAAWKKDLGVRIYGISLSVVGAALATYHYLGQNGIGTLPCEALGYSVSCAREYVLQFGYITIPIMALSAFVLIGLLLYTSMRQDNLS